MVSLFQRIRTPFADRAEDDFVQPDPAAHAIGERLRERREELGLDLESIGDALRIKPVYLAALEQGRARDLPGPTYAIGFIRAYAQYLGFNSERVLERYKAESGEIHTRPDLTLPVPLGERSLPGVPILLVGLILALCGYGTWYYVSTGDRSRPERVAAVPAELRQAVQGGKVDTPVPLPASRDVARLASGLSSAPEAPPPDVVAGVAAASARPAAAPAEANPSPPRANSPPATGASAAATSPPAPNADATAKGGGIDIRAVSDCWIQVRAGDNGTIVFSRVLKAGETYHVPRPGLLLRTGNAGALAIVVDGKPAPSIGAVGALRREVALDPAALLAGTAVHG
jgi:cytoskeleton protein RodZ